MHSISEEAAKFKNELNPPEILPTENEVTTIFAKRVKQRGETKSQPGKTRRCKIKVLPLNPIPPTHHQRWHKSTLQNMRRYEETIDHIVCGCPELAKTEYIHRHNKIAA